MLSGIVRITQNYNEFPVELDNTTESVLKKRLEQCCKRKLEGLMELRLCLSSCSH